MMEFT
jgi:hypothetical protein